MTRWSLAIAAVLVLVYLAGGCASDGNQSGSFLAAARDWQEKTAVNVDGARWGELVPVGSLEEAVRTPQPDAQIALAQMTIICMAADINLGLMACGDECHPADIFKDPTHDATCADHQSQMREKMAQFARAAQAYGAGQFDRVTLSHLMFNEPAPEHRTNPR